MLRARALARVSFASLASVACLALVTGCGDDGGDDSPEAQAFCNVVDPIQQLPTVLENYEDVAGVEATMTAAEDALAQVSGTPPEGIAEELRQAESGERTSRSEQRIAAIRSQLAAAERLDRTIAETHDRLRLLDARFDETVTRTVELSVTQADAALGDLVGPGGVSAELDSIVDDMEALRQAVEETHRADRRTGGSSR